MWSDWRTATGAAESHVALLGLGTNIGDRTANLGAAVQGIGALGRIDALSRVYDSEPFGDTDQPRFLNMALRLRTSLAPSDLLHELKQLEQRMGRTPTHRMGPRIIDIDILFYDDIRLDTPRLTVPHPGVMDRSFVLAPLLDIEPDLRHPVTGERLADRLATIGSTGLETVGDAVTVLPHAEDG